MHAGYRLTIADPAELQPVRDMADKGFALWQQCSTLHGPLDVTSPHPYGVPLATIEIVVPDRPRRSFEAVAKEYHRI